MYWKCPIQGNVSRGHLLSKRRKDWWSYDTSWGCCNQYHKLCGLKRHRLIFLTALEAKSLKAFAGHIPSIGSREEWFFLSGFWWLLTLGWWQHCSSPCLRVSTCCSPCVCLCLFSFYEDTSHNWIWYHLVLTQWHLQRPSPKKGHVHRYGWTWIWGDSIQPKTRVLGQMNVS